MATQPESYPARLDIDYPEKLDRLTTFFRLIWAIPILIVLSVISATSTSTATVVTRTGEVVSKATNTGGGIAAGLFGATLLMILFRQRYPRGGSTSPGSSRASGPGWAPARPSPRGRPSPSSDGAPDVSWRVHSRPRVTGENAGGRRMVRRSAG